ncbi:MAG: YjjG family noncanonical pyrimidine nucleotidase [Spirochaetales bacterium]|jgi:2-haloacid dehalogenase|nr:YjjG family noncanonical pyrimidine nucleotidase [Spirochaetales bacterium]
MAEGKYRLLYLDADDTLFDYHKAEQFSLSRALGETGIDSPPAYLEEYQRINRAVWLEYEEGRLTQPELRIKRFRLLFESIGLKNSPNPEVFSRTYLKYLAQAAFLIPGAQEICRYLGARYTLALITNGLSEIQRSRIRLSPLKDTFPYVIISEEAGDNKPNPGIFAYGERQTGRTDKNSILIIGDSLTSDIQGGFNYGIDTCWFNPRRAENPTTLRPTYEIHSLEQLKDFL